MKNNIRLDIAHPQKSRAEFYLNADYIQVLPHLLPVASLSISVVSHPVLLACHPDVV